MKECTTIYQMYSNGDGTYTHEVSYIYYSNYPSFDRLPTIAQTEEIKAEYDKYWKWFKKNDRP